jgi:hypothetical protein
MHTRKNIPQKARTTKNNNTTATDDISTALKQILFSQWVSLKA